tara:strand:- start:88 stop:495 length:408 start_codon:yes stop_codon:yes gene_type:complete
MKIIGIEHVGIAVEDLKKSGKFWDYILESNKKYTEIVEDQDVITDIYDTGQGKIELLFSQKKNSIISKFLKKRGQGIHHICLKVENIKVAIEELNKKGVELIGDNYTIGAEGYKIIFIHPRSTGGVLVELAEAKE